MPKLFRVVAKPPARPAPRPLRLLFARAARDGHLAALRPSATWSRPANATTSSAPTHGRPAAAPGAARGAALPRHAQRPYVNRLASVALAVGICSLRKSFNPEAPHLPNSRPELLTHCASHALPSRKEQPTMNMRNPGKPSVRRSAWAYAARNAPGQAETYRMATLGCAGCTVATVEG